MAISRMDAAPRRLSVPRYLLLQAAAGALLGALAAGALLLTDAFGLGRLLAGDLVAIAVFICGGIATVTPLYFATAIGLLAGPDEPPPAVNLALDKFSVRSYLQALVSRPRSLTSWIGRTAPPSPLPAPARPPARPRLNPLRKSPPRT